jgi:tetratricopeptide (TPR) repeat protein
MENKKTENMDDIVALAQHTQKYIDLLVEQSDNWQDPPTVDEIIRQKKKNAKKKGSQGGIIGLVIIVAIAITSICFPERVKAQDVDSLYQVCLQSEGSKRLDAINAFNRVLAGQGVVEEKQFSKADNIIEAESYMIFSLAIYYSQHGQYARSIDVYEQSVQLSRSINDSLQICRTLQNLYGSYTMTDNFDKALACLEESLRIAYALNNDDYIGYNLLMTGDFYLRNEQYDVAEDYFRKSLQIEKQREDTRMIIAALEKLGNIYIFQNRLDKVKEIGVEMEELKKKDLNQMSLFTVFLIEARVHKATNQLNKSLASLDSCLAISESLQMDDYSLGALLDKCDIYEIQNQMKKANETLSRCKAICEKNGRSSVLLGINRELYNINKSLNPTLAMSSIEEYIALSDSLNSEELDNRLADFRIQYETAEKQIEIERQKSELQRSKTMHIFLVIGLILVGLILILTFLVLQYRTKRNRILTEMNTTKDKFFSIISHDMKNPAIAMQTALGMLVEHATEMDADSLQTYYAKLLKSADGQVELLYNLLNWAQIQTGRMPFRPFNISLRSVVHEEAKLSSTPVTRSFCSPSL